MAEVTAAVIVTSITTGSGMPVANVTASRLRVAPLDFIAGLSPVVRHADKLRCVALASRRVI
jgi:hypothetical protein